jgi:hypothetical protein
MIEVGLSDRALLPGGQLGYVTEKQHVCQVRMTVRFRQRYFVFLVCRLHEDYASLHPLEISRLVSALELGIIVAPNHQSSVNNGGRIIGERMIFTFAQPISKESHGCFAEIPQNEEAACQ